MRLPRSIYQNSMPPPRPALTNPCENQLLPALGPKKSPARTIRTPTSVDAASRSRRSHLDANPTLGGDGILRRRLAQIREGVWSEIVDGARQDNPSAIGASRRDRVVQHRQHKLAPIAIARGVHSVHDHRNTIRRCDVGCGHCIASMPNQS
jgi:hypothetical protein